METLDGGRPAQLMHAAMSINCVRSHLMFATQIIALQGINCAHMILASNPDRQIPGLQIGISPHVRTFSILETLSPNRLSDSLHPDTVSL